VNCAGGYWRAKDAGASEVRRVNVRTANVRCESCGRMIRADAIALGLCDSARFFHPKYKCLSAIFKMRAVA
jgi:hypothetical protein